MIDYSEKLKGTWNISLCKLRLWSSCHSGYTTQSTDIHYWIGNTSSQDEQGAAAIYVTQLDEYLGGSPVQHREVQGCESAKFKSYFKNGLIYKKGGVGSGFTHVETNMYSMQRLLHVKGTKHVTAREVNYCTRHLKSQFYYSEGSPSFILSVSDASGQLLVQEVATSPLTQDLLSSSDCYILDQGGSSVMVWKGKAASDEERRSALSRAVGFIKAKNYPSNTKVEVMSEGGESAMFKHLFKSWKEKGQTQGLGKTHSVGKIAKVDQVKFDVMELHAQPKLAAQERMVDDASGHIQVWRIENLELKEVNPSTYGQFYGGDCYLVLYTYNRANKPQYILYMWQGRHATQDEVTACAYQAVNLDNKYNGAPTQVRVVMGKEPRHFLAIFKGGLIIFEGGTGRPGVVNRDPGARLFQVRGTHEMNTKATEVPTRASSLNTNDVFLLKTDQNVFLWYGKGCSGDEREMGKAVADLLSEQDKQVVMEGQEPAAFWVALGGKAPYASDKRLEKEVAPHEPRLFECSNQTGRFLVTEVADFTQDDLDEDDVMLLDTWEEIFLWIGNSANQYETQESYSSAVEYLKTHPAGRDPGTPVSTVKQGYEPPTFTGWFNAWDAHKWSVSQTDQSPSRAKPSGMLHSEQLVKKPNQLPQGVDPEKREEYLTDAEFENLFGCTRDNFQRLPKWRQNDLKKKAGMF
uniref:Advillin-like n=1 Tax=Sinocyclocheilus anshuiensis TaxID=1608454 RepID=A0A671RGH2_9TELE